MTLTKFCRRLLPPPASNLRSRAANWRRWHCLLSGGSFCPNAPFIAKLRRGLFVHKTSNYPSVKSVKQGMDHLVYQHLGGIGWESRINQFQTDCAVNARP